MSFPHSLENYEIIKILGSGAFSTVYLAKQLSTGQDTAVKVLDENTLSGSDSKEARVHRFKREMKLCSNLYHPNIVKVLDFGKTIEGALYTVFEYVPGKTLARIIEEEGALKVKRTFGIMEQILSAISSAHQKGIIHRDLKPENIMITENSGSDSVKLLDFGIGTFVEEDRDSVKVTMTHDFLGTPAYAAPEQVRAEKVTHKADIFAWGLIFIECLTGENAYRETNRAKLIQKQLSKNPVPLPNSLNSTPLGNYLSWILQKDPSRRAADSSEVHRRFSMIPADSIPASGGFLSATENPAHELVNINKDEFDALHNRKISILECELSVTGNIPESKSQLTDCLLEETYELCRTISEKNGGWTAVGRGSRRTFYFGYPSAADFHTRGAAKTALDISSTLVQSEKSLKIRHGADFSWRMAVHTGSVTIRKSEKESSVFGNTLSKAGRLCSEAGNRQIAVSPEVHSRLFKTFNFQEDGGRLRLTGLREVESLFSRYKNENLVGRNEELQTLEAIRLKSLDSGQAVIVQGEPGIGKSRFMAESVTTTAIERSSIYELLCYPENKNSALAPFLKFLEKYFKLSEFSSDQSRDKAVFGEINNKNFDAGQYLSLLYYWLGINSTGFPPLEVSPKKQKEQFLEMTSSLFFNHILEEKSTLICDDLQWIDPTSLELLSMMLDNVSNHNCIILMSARPEFISPWNKQLISLINLKGLDKKEVRIMIESKLQETDIPAKTVEKIIDRVDGNPLFAEEVLNNIKSLGSDGAKMKVPESLEDLFSSRLQSLGEARSTAQLASVIGRKFNYELLKQIHTGDEGTLLADLTQLLASNFIHIVPHSHSLEYVFHHALVCENAYNSLNKKEIRKTHRKVAVILEDRFDDDEDKYNPIARELSHHFEKAGDFESALKYQQISGKQLLRLNAFKEAAEYFEMALKSIEKIERNDLLETELDIKIKLGVCLKSAYGWDHQRAAELYDSAIKMNDLCGGKFTTEIAPIIFGRWASVMMKLELKKALSLAEQYLDFALNTENDEVLMQAHLTFANNLFWIGDIEGTGENIKKCLKFHKNLDSENLINKGGFEPVTIARMFEVFCLWHSGLVNEANSKMEQYINDTRTLKNPFSTAVILQAGAWHYYHCRNYEKCLRNSEELVQLSNRYNFSFYEGIGLLFKGWSLAENDAGKGEKLIRKANSEFINPQGGNFFNSVYKLTLADTLLAQDKLAEAGKELSEALETAIRRQENAYVPEIYRSLADIDTCTGEFEEASHKLKMAAETAGRQKMSVFKLRAALDSVSLQLIQEKDLDIKQLIKSCKSFHNSSFNELTEAQEIIEDFNCPQ